MPVSFLALDVYSNVATRHDLSGRTSSDPSSRASNFSSCVSELLANKNSRYCQKVQVAGYSIRAVETVAAVAAERDVRKEKCPR